MATHPQWTAHVAASTKTNTASAQLMGDDVFFDDYDAGLAAAVDNIIENHNRESEKVNRERGRGRRRGRENCSRFDPT